MKKNILFAILATGCLLTHTACEDGKDEYLSDFSTILYFRNSGELPLTVYKTGENTDYQLIVNKSGSTLGATASIDVGIMSDASLAAYNAAEHAEDRYNINISINRVNNNIEEWIAVSEQIAAELGRI